MSNAGNKFGIEKENKIIYTKTVPKLDSKSTHIVIRLLEIAKLFNIKADNSKNWIGYYPDYISLRKADDFLKKTFRNQNFLIGINISAGSEARFWGVERFKSLIDFLLTYKVQAGINLNILIISAPKDLHYAKNITQDKTNQAAIFSSKILMSSLQ